ncbi:MAG: GNAT family N-acetyltransferase [Neomegalonema sp.]|nr:GNAT family N-acetyltransferase [Neomegalonema sp.]
MPEAQRLNAFGQPIGPDLIGWSSARAPLRAALEGRFARLEPLSPASHGAALWQGFEEAPQSLWTYMAYGPFADRAAFDAFLDLAEQGDDPLYFAICDASSGRALGLAAYLRMMPGTGSIEIGALTYTPALQRSRIASEAQFLFMRHAFADLGYRRYEWKCDALNAPSRAAAERLGFTYEGTFRCATVYKGRSRDTAWYSITADEWPSLASAHERWLAPENFDADGQQRARLRDLIAEQRGAA